MQIVWKGETDGDTAQSVHTIDVWFSRRRQTWCVERLDADGHQIGLAHRCASEAEAASCVEEWLRAHAETELVAPNRMMRSEGCRHPKGVRRRAA